MCPIGVLDSSNFRMVLTASCVSATQVTALLVLKVSGARGLLGRRLSRKPPLATDDPCVYTLFKNGLRRGIEDCAVAIGRHDVDWLGMIMGEVAVKGFEGFGETQ